MRRLKLLVDVEIIDPDAEDFRAEDWEELHEYFKQEAQSGFIKINQLECELSNDVSNSQSNTQH